MSIEKTLSDRANEFQRRAAATESFEGTMRQTILAYQAKIALAKITFQDDPDKLEAEIHLWQSSIENANLAIDAYQKALASAQAGFNTIMEFALKEFLDSNDLDFDIDAQDGNWLASTEF